MKKVDKNTIKKGDKVVPIDKTIWNSLDECNTWNTHGGKEQVFLYFKGHDEERCCALCSDKNTDEVGSDYFNYSDLVLYEEEPNALHKVVFPTELPPAIQDRIKELEEEVKRLKEKYEPFDIGELYAFADDADAFEKSIFVVGILEKVNIDFECPFKPKGHDCGFVYARKIKTIELC